MDLTIVGKLLEKNVRLKEDTSYVQEPVGQLTFQPKQVGYSDGESGGAFDPESGEITICISSDILDNFKVGRSYTVTQRDGQRYRKCQQYANVAQW